METILRLLPVLACPIMMGLLIWAMSRNNTNNTTATATDMNVQRAQGVQEPYRATAANASPFRSVVDMIKCCLNPKVLAGLAVVGVGVLVIAPNLAASVLPLLVVLACPLSMLFMMRAMRGQMNDPNSAVCEHCAPHQEQTRQPVVIDQIASPKSRKLPANAGESVGLAQTSQKREGVLVPDSSQDG